MRLTDTMRETTEQNHDANIRHSLAPGTHQAGDRTSTRTRHIARAQAGHPDENKTCETCDPTNLELVVA